MKDEFEFCLRCHRKLKNEEARKIGYGKVCLKKVKEQKPKATLFKVTNSNSDKYVV